jgi:hypothetical protein
VTTSPAAAGPDPRQLLTENRRLARQVRATQRATWFPLLVLAAVTFVAVPVYRYGHYTLTCRNGPGGGRVCLAWNASSLIYWPIALVLAYVVIAGFYLHRARVRGVGTRVYLYAAVGILLAVATAGAAAWLSMHPPLGGYRFLGLSGPGQLLFWLVSPAFAVGLGLVALAVVERSWALALLAGAYLAFALVPGEDLGWVLRYPSPWAQVPRLVLGGSVLLLAGLAFAWAQRPRRHAPA